MIKNLKAKDLRNKTKDILLKELEKMSKELMKLRILQAEENNNKNHIFYVMRKNISRILTVLGEKNG